MDCLALAKMYAVLDSRRKFLLRRIERDRKGLKTDTTILKEWKQKHGNEPDPYDRMRREMRTYRKRIRRYRYRLGTIAPLIAMIERSLMNKNAKTPTERHAVDMWPNWMDRDGNLKTYQ
jgi:hypothetical protein